MNNKLIRVQEIIFDQLNRLSDENLMRSGFGKREIERSNVISNNAQTFIKVVNLNLKIQEVARRNQTQNRNLLQELDLIDNNNEEETSEE
jgi:hypothetical protein